jgi:hypothetical protein
VSNAECSATSAGVPEGGRAREGGTGLPASCSSCAARAPPGRPRGGSGGPVRRPLRDSPSGARPRRSRAVAENRPSPSTAAQSAAESRRFGRCCGGRGRGRADDAGLRHRLDFATDPGSARTSSAVRDGVCRAARSAGGRLRRNLRRSRFGPAATGARQARQLAVVDDALRVPNSLVTAVKSASDAGDWGGVDLLVRIGESRTRAR